MPAGSPLLDTLHHLFTKFCILAGAGRLRRKREDRFLIGRSLFKTHALGNNRLEDLWPEDAPDLLIHFPREGSTLIKKGHEHTQYAQIRVRTCFDLLDGLQKIIRTLERIK